MNLNIHKTFLSIFIVAATIVPTIIGFAFGWNVLKGFAIQFVITVYAISTVVHFVAQIIFAELNRRRVESIARRNEIDTPESTYSKTDEEKGLPNGSYAIQVVGKGEDPLYFKQCLLKVKRIMQDPLCVKVFICIDGLNEDSMMEVVKNTMDAKIIRTDNILQNQNLFDRAQFASLCRDKVVCIMQPHKGKRYAMYTASWLACHMDIEYICMTDSDTLLDVNAVKYLKQTMNEDIAASTGLVKIFNINNFLSFIIDIKYWCAFNIERAAQSYFGAVACVSGPLGFYRCSVLKVILDDWVTQTFMGKQTTFGDDRHLTNLIISLGHKVVYTHKAFCYTETPTGLLRWWTQQARWGRSFFREYLIGLKWLYRSLWLAYDITYLVFYSVFLFAFACMGIPYLTTSTLLLTCLTTIIASGCRSLYAVVLSGDLKYFCFLCYGSIYFCWLLPLKIWSSLTVFVVRWGTSMRNTSAKCNELYFDTWPVVAWCIYILYGIVNACVYNNSWHTYDAAYATLIGVFLSFAFLIYRQKREHLFRTQMRVFVDDTS